MSWLGAVLAVAPVWLMLVVVFLLPAVEPVVPVVGMLFPSQTVLVASGVLANRGVLPVVGAFTVAVLGAVAGNVLGHAVGRRWGARISASLPERMTRSRAYGAALGTVGTYYGRAVLLGRFNGGLRSLVPVLCGTVRVPWAPYLGWSLLAALLWAPACVGTGLLAGSSWQKWGGSGVLAVASVVLLLTTSLPLLLSARKSRDGGTGRGGRVTDARPGTPPARPPLGPDRSGPQERSAVRTPR